MKEDIEDDDVNNKFYYCPFIVKLQQVIAVSSHIKAVIVIDIETSF